MNTYLILIKNPHKKISLGPNLQDLHFITLRSFYSRATDHYYEYWMIEADDIFNLNKIVLFSTNQEYWKRR